MTTWEEQRAEWCARLDAGLKNDPALIAACARIGKILAESGGHESKAAS